MHPIKFLPFAFFALLVLPFVPGLAEDKSTDEAAKLIRPDPSLISIDFPGGPLSKLVASLGTSKGAKLSIIQTGGLDPVLPAFAVHSVPVEAVLIALMRIVEPQGYSLNLTGFGLAVLTKNENVKAPAFASFQLETKLGNRSVEEVIAAIQMGCEFADPEQKASTLRFKYHPGTKLLFVAGSRQEVDVAYKVFGSLPDNPVKTPVPANDKK